MKPNKGGKVPKHLSRLVRSVDHRSGADYYLAVAAAELLDQWDTGGNLSEQARNLAAAFDGFCHQAGEGGGR